VAFRLLRLHVPVPARSVGWLVVQFVSRLVCSLATDILVVCYHACLLVFGVAD
jgi:hypothetical protein